MIEWLIYLFLTLFLLVCIFQLSSIINTKLKSDIQYSFQKTQLYAGFDMLLRDLISSPHKIEEWKKKDTHELAWYCPEQASDIQWYVNNGDLLRVKAIYKNGKQQKAKKNLVASGVKSLNFIFDQYQDRVISIKCCLEVESSKFERTIFLRNGVLR